MRAARGTLSLDFARDDGSTLSCPGSPRSALSPRAPKLYPDRAASICVSARSFARACRSVLVQLHSAHVTFLGLKVKNCAVSSGSLYPKRVLFTHAVKLRQLGACIVPVT